MPSLTNLSLMTYLILVAIIGTLGNGVILLAYGNRWNSSKSTSVVFILILSCVDLWTCLIVVPTIAIMEHRDFDVPTLICRFYSFSKNLIIISSFIMSFIAFDRFLNIALPHYRLLNPRRVKVLLTVFISIGIGLGTLTALAFSTQPSRSVFDATYDLQLPSEPYVKLSNRDHLSFDLDQNTSSTEVIMSAMKEQLSLPNDSNVTAVSLEYNSTMDRCFADTTIISETIRQVLKHISNKFFFVSIGIVTILYTITFVLALQRQKPRIRALKKSLNVLNRFDTSPSNKGHGKQTDLIATASLTNSGTPTKTRTAPSRKATTPTNEIKSTSATRSSLCSQQYEMSKMIVNDDCDDLHPSATLLQKAKNCPEQDAPISTSEGTSDDLQTCTDKPNGSKQVSFQLEQRRNILKKHHTTHLSISSVSSDVDLAENNDIHYKLPCPCSQTRQFLIKFHFAGPTSYFHRWLCCCCYVKTPVALNHHHPSTPNAMEDEATTILPPPIPYTHQSSTHSETLKRQLHQHRLKQIRMASTFLLITVSFVLFYLPSILNAERIIKSPMTIYYLYLCTHALNPLIYCFMNPSLRAYVISMFNCRSRRQRSFKSKTGPHSFAER